MNNNEYFLVEHVLSVNLQSIEESQLPLDQLAFEDEIPGPFRMASDLAEVDASILLPLKLNNDNTQALWNYLQAQNKKINTLLSYVLTQQDDQKTRYKTTHFSAGTFIVNDINTSNTWKIGDNVRIKIFLPEESSAIYCYATVSDIDDTKYIFTYTFIREQDRELLIRASLHVQSQQLKNRVKKRELKS